MKRRDFSKGASALMAGGLVIGPTVLSANNRRKRISANDKLQIGVIGCNGMGWSDTYSMLKMKDVDLVAICDVDANVVKRRVEGYSKMRKNTPKTYADYRELLRDSEIDAVVIGKPDHWHCKIMIDAVKAGKHVYFKWVII